MNKRKLLIGLLLAGVFSVGMGAGVFPAAAEPRTFLVTLSTGQTLTVTMDVPAGTPLSEIRPAGVTGPIVGIQEITPGANGPVQVGTTPAPAEEPAPGGGEPQPSSSGEPAGAAGERQKTSGRKLRNPKAEGKAAPGAVVAAPNGSAEAEETEEQLRSDSGAPTPDNPTFSLALPGPAPIGVPNFFIQKFRIPPFLLPIYQAAGIQYGVRWEILAGINEIETDYGRNLNVSSAGALGWMQFMPATWKAYGVDANKDGVKDPYNPVDAIFAAARYLKAAGAATDIRRALFAYNHANWYVDSVLLRSRVIAGMPPDLVGSLTGLTQARFPVHAKARYADDMVEAELEARREGNPAVAVEGDPRRKGINIYARRNAPVIAVQDGKVVRMGVNRQLGRFVQLRDVYGNTYTYAHLGSVAKAVPVPKERKVTRAQVARELKLPKPDPRPDAPASAGVQPTPEPRQAKERIAARPAPAPSAEAPRVRKERLYANPARPLPYRNGGEDQLLDAGAEVPGYTTFKNYFTSVFGLKRDDVVLKRLEVGSRVIGGTILGRIGKVAPKVAPHVHFRIRPGGKNAPLIDPKPILDGWKLLETTAIYRAAGKNPFFGPDAKNPTIGQILLMSKEGLQRRVLADPHIDIYECGRRDIRAGIIDRRVLATLSFLSANGLRPTVTSLRCGHSYLTASGNVSHHSSGNAVDIAAINGIPILGHQGSGSVTDITIRRMLTLQGTMRPDQIISLMTYEGASNTLHLPDHADHIHVGFQPHFGVGGKLSRRAEAVLKPGQWIKLIGRLSDIENPSVRVKPSKYAITVEPPQRASHAHRGE